MIDYCCWLHIMKIILECYFDDTMALGDLGTGVELALDGCWPRIIVCVVMLDCASGYIHRVSDS